MTNLEEENNTVLTYDNLLEVVSNKLLNKNQTASPMIIIGTGPSKSQKLPVERVKDIKLKDNAFIQSKIKKKK